MNFDSLLLKIIILLDLEKYSEKVISIMDPTKIILIFSYGIFLFISSIFFIIIFYKNFNNIKKCFSNFVTNQKKLIEIIINNKIYLIIVIPIFFNLYLAFELPTTYDEAWTFNNFIDKGIFISLTYYPMPNNHVFYSAISSLLNFFIDSKSIIPFRLLSSIFFIFSILILIKILTFKKLNLGNINFFLISIAPMSLVALYQTSLARGYGLLLFLFLINIYLILKLSQKNSNIFWILWSIVSSLCFFTNPGYFYSHFIICLLMPILIKNILSKLFFYNLIILLITFFLYFPIIIFQGIDFLFKIKTEINYNIYEYLDHIKNIIVNDIFGLNIYVIIILWLVGSFLLLSKVSKKIFFIFTFLTVIPLFIPFLHNSIPPGRIFIVFYFLFYVGIFLGFQKIINKQKKNRVIIFSIILQILLITNFSLKMPLQKYSKDIEQFSLKILSDSQKYLFCSNKTDPLIPTLLDFYTRKHDYKKIQIIKVKKDFCNYEDYKNYDWVLIDQNIDFTIKNSSLKFSTDSWNFYSKKHKIKYKK